MGVGHKAVRKRAVGTRERIIAYLAEAGELYDANGMASTQLAAAVGYPGSSVAFAQLLSGMERSGLIAREVRGKRTYRIGLGVARTAGPGRAVAGGVPGVRADPAVPGIGAAGPGAAGFDYDELARRLLVQVVRRLAATEPEEGPLEASPAPDQPPPPDQLALQETVSGLEDDQLRIHVSNWLSEQDNARWLLIFDNYDDPDQYQVGKYYPSVAQGSVIVTTRLPDRVKGQQVRLRSMRRFFKLLPASLHDE